MNLYGINYSLFDLGFIDPSLIESISVPHQTTSDGESQQQEGENLLGSSNFIGKNKIALSQHRHDGTSPLPLGMDWSPLPRLWVRFLPPNGFLLEKLIIYFIQL